MRGSRPGERRGGRQRGTKNKRTVAAERAIADAAAKITGALGADAFQGDAHALLMAVYKDTAQPIELRVLAARAAIGYEKPRLASFDAKMDGQITLAMLVSNVEERRRARLISNGYNEPLELTAHEST
jgi:hypothetical protein